MPAPKADKTPTRKGQRAAPARDVASLAEALWCVKFVLCVAVSCSEWQCVAVLCSALQYAARDVASLAEAVARCYLLQ